MQMAGRKGFLALFSASLILLSSSSVAEPGTSALKGRALPALPPGEPHRGNCQQLLGGGRRRAASASASARGAGALAPPCRGLLLNLRGGGDGIKLKAVTCPDKGLALTNRIFVSGSDHARLGGAQHVSIEGWVYALSPCASVEDGGIALSSCQRRTLQASLGDEIEASPFAPPDVGIAAAALELSAEYAGRKPAGVAPTLDSGALAEAIGTKLRGQVVGKGQLLVTEVRGVNLQLKVVGVAVFREGGVQVEDALGEDEVRERWAGGGVSPGSKMGLVTASTQITVSPAPDSGIKFGGGGGAAGGAGGGGKIGSSRLFRPDFHLEEMGIGGLDGEVGSVFRRAFASRVYPAAVLKRMGVNHVRGVLLYGPPGCGKTLIARKIGKMLCDREPKIVNGPELLNAYVGQSEENVRNLFADAKREYAEVGDESALHVIIFDEIDALCKRRGSSAGDTGVGDSVVNQLLTYIDGVESLNNVLVIGMTNRKDMLDEALLRPGRLEVQVEIGLPSYEGRLQIVRIHTHGMTEGGHLATDVDLIKLAVMTENYSGAEIEGVCRAAASSAFDRNIKVAEGHLSTADADSVTIEWNDFKRALSEVRPAFGADVAALRACCPGGMIDFGPRFSTLRAELGRFFAQVSGDNGASLLSVLVSGPMGSGKTALAASVALQSGVPLMRMVSASTLVSSDEGARVAALERAFDEAYKSPTSIVVIDGIEKLLGWSRIGPRFFNDVAQAIAVLTKKQPPSGRRLLVVGTTSNKDAMAELELIDAFDACIQVPLLSVEEAASVMEQAGGMAHADAAKASQDAFASGQGVAVREILTIMELAKDAGGEGGVTREVFGDCARVVGRGT